MPKTTEEWLDIAKVFNDRWNFPNCCGAIDGKHVQIQSPPNTHSEFVNYKKTFSIILFALVDGNYCFRYIDVGANGNAGDSTIFKDSTLRQALENNTIGFPE